MSRRNRGLSRRLSFPITADMHDALIEYITKVENLGYEEAKYGQGAPLGSYGMADYLRNILGAFLSKELDRKVKVYESE